jgi:hypothetical protein
MPHISGVLSYKMQAGARCTAVTIPGRLRKTVGVCMGAERVWNKPQRSAGLFTHTFFSGNLAGAGVGLCQGTIRRELCSAW